MLNIISKCLLFKGVSGPKKGIENFIKGLDILGYPYVINKGLDSCKRLYIHDDAFALSKIHLLPPNIKVIVGPCLYNLVKDIPKELDISRAIYLQPSEWSKQCFLDFGFDKCKLDFWPMGIDTDSFKPSKEKKDIVLIYFKQRFKEELEKVEAMLRSKNIDFRAIVYGNYIESDYQNLLSRSKYIIWVGRQESQGLALQEALASDVPILVWDVSYMGHSDPNSDFTPEESAYKNTTSAPYFDENCGLKIKKIEELPSAIDFMENNLRKFKPRDFILNNLSLDGRAREFLGFYEKYFGLSYESGFNEKLLNNSDWINAKWYYVLYLKFKHKLKMILVKMGLWEYVQKKIKR